MNYTSRSLLEIVICVILLMGIVIYLNQEVPACIDSPTPKNITLTTNFSQPVVEELDTKLQSDVVVFQTSGDSMKGTISDNSKCICIKKESYLLGDIVVFFANSGNGFQGVAHKIIFKNETEIITKGTNNKEADYPIKEENILCKIATIERYKLYGL